MPLSQGKLTLISDHSSNSWAQLLGNDAPSSPGLLPPCGFRNRVRTPVPKGRASQVWLDLLPERDYSVQMGGNCSALAILERQ